MAQITGGKYSYTRVVKDDDYGIKREFSAELTFNVGEDDPVGDIGVEIAQRVVDITHEKLRIKSATASVPAAASEIVKTGSPSPVGPSPAAAVPVNDKEKLAAEAVARATPAPTKPKRAPKAEAAPVPVVEDDLSELFGETAAPARVITDKDLMEAVTKKNATLKDPPKIVALRIKYVGQLPKQMRDIPQEKREEFLKELDALS
jgi:hypothetical protein